MAFNAEIPNALVRAVAEGKAIALVGSGLSRSVKRSNGIPLPTWPELLTELLGYAHREGISLSGLEDELRSAVASGRLLLAAQELQVQIEESNIARFFQEVFLDDGVRPGPVQQRLVEIPFLGVLTTNYDTLIEGAYTVKFGGRSPRVLTQEDLEKVQNPLRTKGPFVFKLHGDINRPDTIVLGSHDYQSAMFRRPGYRSFLETSFTVNTALFLGFGLEDPDIDMMLDHLAAIFSRTNESHFALVPSGKFSRLERRRLALDKRIRVIEYENEDRAHGQVLEFLNYLYELTAPAGALREEYIQKLGALLDRPASPIQAVSVMIMHAGEDRPFVRQLAEDLQKNGISVRYDEWAIQVGDALVALSAYPKINQIVHE